jgi:hypothetical protein
MARVKSRARKNVAQGPAKKVRAASPAAEPRQNAGFKRPPGSDKAAPKEGPRVNRSAQRALRTHRRRPGTVALK